jgi:hypothetical protein
MTRRAYFLQGLGSTIFGSSAGGAGRTISASNFGSASMILIAQFIAAGSAAPEELRGLSSERGRGEIRDVEPKGRTCCWNHGFGSDGNVAAWTGRAPDGTFSPPPSETERASINRITTRSPPMVCLLSSGV